MQYDNSDSTPSMAFNVLASYANAGKFNSRPSAAVTALKIIPCFSCSSLTTDVARQLATVRGRYRGFGFAQLWRSAGLLADDFDSAGFGPSFVIRARWIGPSSLRVPSEFPGSTFVHLAGTKFPAAAFGRWAPGVLRGTSC